MIAQLVHIAYLEPIRSLAQVYVPLGFSVLLELLRHFQHHQGRMPVILDQQTRPCASQDTSSSNRHKISAKSAPLDILAREEAQICPRCVRAVIIDQWCRQQGACSVPKAPFILRGEFRTTLDVKSVHLGEPVKKRVSRMSR